jgi:hypothetical protein
MPNSSTARRTEPWRVVHQAADSHVATFTGPFVASVEALRRRVSLEQLEDAVTQGTITWELSEAIDGLVLAKAADPAELATKVYSQVIVASVTGMADWVAERFGQPAAQLVGRFNLTSPFVLRAARDMSANLIRGVGAETKLAVRRLIFNGIRDGVPPRDTARLLRLVLGLSERDALAVDRLRAGLLEGGTKLSLVERRSAQYADRLLRQRALTVARTETMFAANRGQQELWRAMRDEGVVPADMGQRWLTTPDDRLCPRCAPLNGRVVQLGFLFRETERGVLPSRRVPVAGVTVLSPPLHPRCRCVLVFDDDLT